jgi:hypothetical protein
MTSTLPAARVAALRAGNDLFGVNDTSVAVDLHWPAAQVQEESASVPARPSPLTIDRPCATASLSMR